MRVLAAAMMLVLGASVASAEVRTKVVEYTQGSTPLQGLMAWDDAVHGRRPGVLIAHDWMGVGPFAEGRARELAKLGYVAFCADIYGKGVRPANAEQAAKTAAIYKGDRPLTRARVAAALDVLRADPLVDPKRIAAIGYCFGGMVVLELARSGADIAGVVVFHGTLDTPTPGDARNIRGKVLALQGADDPFVGPKDVAAFEQEMRAGHVDWELVQYGNAVHAFTNPAAGNDNSRGAAYNAEADRRSWQTMKDFFAEIFH